MPCGLCNRWIVGEWMSWKRCFATPTEGNRILAHTDPDSRRDITLVIHLVRSKDTGAAWYFCLPRLQSEASRRTPHPFLHIHAQGPSFWRPSKERTMVGLGRCRYMVRISPAMKRMRLDKSFILTELSKDRACFFHFVAVHPTTLTLYFSPGSLRGMWGAPSKV